MAVSVSVNAHHRHTQRLRMGVRSVWCRQGLSTRQRQKRAPTSREIHNRIGMVAGSSPGRGADMGTGAVPDEAVAFAHSLAEAAARETLPYFRRIGQKGEAQVEDKGDASPVTIADRNAELAMRKLIKEKFPSHGICGEEFGKQEGDGDYMWVLDPIDGTKSFITGKPLFTTLISLVYRGNPILGVIDQPFLKERWLGVAGQRSTLNGTTVSTRDCASLKEAYLYATTPHMFTGKQVDAFEKLRKSTKIALYGCDAYAYGLVAAGCSDLVAEADLKPYDYLALVPVVEGAGGRMTDWEGRELRWDGNMDAGCVLASGDKAVHAAALEALARG